MRSKFFDLPLRFQIIIPFSLLIIALGGVAVGFALPLAREAASENVDLKLDSARSLVPSLLDHQLGELQNSAALVAQDPQLTLALSTGDRRQLADVLGQTGQGSLDALQVTDADGETLGAAGGHVPVQAATIASLASQGAPGSVASIVPTTAGHMLVALRPVGPQSSPLGFVAAGRLLSRLLPALRPADGTELALFADGQLAATTLAGDHGRLEEPLALPPDLTRIDAPVKKGSVIGGRPYAAVYDRLGVNGDTSLAFAVFVPKSQVWPPEPLVAGALAAALAVPLILLVLGFATARAIAVRLERVVDVIERIGEGDFQQRVDLNSADEVGRLALGLNRMAARLQEAEVSKAEFLAMASHELRTPLALIHNATELLIDGAPANGETPRGELLQIIAGNIDRMNRRVSDLLDLARLEAGHLTLRSRPVALAPLVEEVAESVGPLLAARSQTLDLDLPSDLPQVNADPDRIQQVLLNLLTNASRHTGPETHICVRASSPGNGRGVSVEVEDDGPGIPPERLERFLNGSRGPHAGEGAGLGLRIAQRLVALHGGRLSARSQPERGALFAFALPVAPEEGGETA